MNDARNEINNAYNLLAALPVRGDAVDVVAAGWRCAGPWS